MTGFFIDANSLKESFDNQLPYLLIAALVLGILYLIFFAKAFPVGWEKQSSGSQMLIILIFILLAFAVSRQSTITLNNLLPYREKKFTKEIILNKEIERTSKGTNFYSLSIKSLLDKTISSFDVSSKEYEKYSIGDTVQREIFTGYFNIKYAK